MATDVERNWTAHVVLSSEHAGLKPLFKAFENEMYRVLARVNDPNEVRQYLFGLIGQSRDWLTWYGQHEAKK